MATISVRGEGGVSATPDLVEMALVLTAEDVTPDGALDAVAASDAKLRGILDELAIPERARNTTGATVGERLEYDRANDRQIRSGYRAAVTLWVKLDDLSMPGKLMREATSRVGAQVQGPIWRLARDHPARLDACRAAAEDAERRATAYADTVGMRLGPLIAMSESVDPTARGVTLSARSSTAGEVGVSPGEQEVVAVVEATYELFEG